METSPATEAQSQRRYPRARVLCSLLACQGNTTKRWLATNINEGGCLILSSAPIEDGTGFSLSLELPNLTLIKAEGEQCSTIPEIGSGIRFTNISPNYCQHIATAVKIALSKDTVEALPLPDPGQMRGPEGVRIEPRICV